MGPGSPTADALSETQAGVFAGSPSESGSDGRRRLGNARGQPGFSAGGIEELYVVRYPCGCVVFPIKPHTFFLAAQLCATSVCASSGSAFSFVFAHAFMLMCVCVISKRRQVVWGLQIHFVVVGEGRRAQMPYCGL